MRVYYYAVTVAVILGILVGLGLSRQLEHKTQTQLHERGF